MFGFFDAFETEYLLASGDLFLPHFKHENGSSLEYVQVVATKGLRSVERSLRYLGIEEEACISFWGR